MDRSTAVTSHAQHVRPPRRGRVGRVSGVLAVIAAASIGATQAQATTYCVNATSCVGTAQPTLDAAITTAIFSLIFHRSAFTIDWNKSADYNIFLEA